MPKGWLKFESDKKEPLVVTPLDWDVIEQWHAKAFELRSQGYLLREIAVEVGRHKGSVQRLLNPDSRRKQKIRQAQREKEKRDSDPNYAEKIRTYVRKYQHLNGGTQKYRKKSASVCQQDRLTSSKR